MSTLQSTDGASAAPQLAPWFHNLHLPGNRRTAPDHPLGDFPKHAREVDEMEAKSIAVVTPPTATPVTIPAPTGVAC